MRGAGGGGAGSGRTNVEAAVAVVPVVRRTVVLLHTSNCARVRYSNFMNMRIAIPVVQSGDNLKLCGIDSPCL